MHRWLLVRRSTDDPSDLPFYLASRPQDTPVEELVRVCEVRWTVEECFAQAKAEIGLDQYEVRRWDAWHRHVTLCLLAHAFPMVTRLAARREEGAGKKGCRDRPDPAHGAGGKAVGARDDRVRKGERLPARMVVVEAGAPDRVAARCRATRRVLLTTSSEKGRSGHSPPRRGPSYPLRSERNHPMPNGNWSGRSCRRSRPRVARRTTTTARCWAASCGWCAPALPGGRWPRSSESGRLHTDGTGCGQSRACSAASSKP
jgi:hypothetical protein